MALSKIPDLTYSYKGQDYIFVDQLEDYLKELECPICQSIVSEPLLTSCGHLFCKECYNKLGSGRRRMGAGIRMLNNATCPVCRQGPNIMQDKFTDRRVKNLKVRCINHREGCKWMGSLGDEGQHRMKHDGCDYEKCLCPQRCGVTFFRMNQQTHSVSCLMRPHKCEYCGEEGPYQRITGEHLETCRRYPVQCPNGCKEKLPREEVLREVKLKEQLSAMAKQLQAREQRVRQLERYILTEGRHTIMRLLIKKVSEMNKKQRIQYGSILAPILICAILASNYYSTLFLLILLSIAACMVKVR